MLEGTLMLRNRKALTLVETLLVIIVFLLAMILMRINAGACNGHDFTTRCENNLRNLGQAMYIYAQDDPEGFPAIGERRDDGLLRIFDPEDRVTMPDMFSVPSPTVDMWVIYREQFVTAEQFICPWTNDEPDPALWPDDHYDFLSSANLSYAYQFQHDLSRSILGPSSGSIPPLLADSNPYIKGGIEADFYADRLSDGAGNSTNHRIRQRGQNVLFTDGRIELLVAPVAGFPGAIDPALGTDFGRDNIYTVFEDVPGGFIDPGSAAPTSNWCNLGGRSDACLVP